MTVDKFTHRRLGLMIFLTVTSFVAGFFWGQINGYRQGKQETLKKIEKKLNEPALSVAL